MNIRLFKTVKENIRGSSYVYYDTRIDLILVHLSLIEKNKTNYKEQYVEYTDRDRNASLGIKSLVLFFLNLFSLSLFKITPSNIEVVALN